MSLKSIVVEVRKNLKCANVFLSFVQNFSNFENTLSIILKQNKILIKGPTSNVEISMDDENIDTNSMSGLIVQGNSASFRISLIQPTDIVDILVNGNSNFFKENLQINLNQQNLYNLNCKICENNFLTNLKSFKRILELPSGSIEVNDWFCHNGPNFDNVLIPKLNDLFYGFYYIVLNKDIVCNYKIKNSNIYCKRCLQYLGELMFSEKAIKFWGDSINAINNNSGSITSIFQNDKINIVLYKLIKNVLIESNLDMSILSMQFSKVLIEAIFPDKKRNFLMFTVLEKDLEIYKNNKTIEDNIFLVKLIKTKCFKILFKVEKDEEQPLLEFWRTDIKVHNIKLSYRQFLDITKLLNEHSTFIPETYRFNNGFILSYVFYPSDA